MQQSVLYGLVRRNDLPRQIHRHPKCKQQRKQNSQLGEILFLKAPHKRIDHDMLYQHENIRLVTIFVDRM